MGYYTYVLIYAREWGEIHHYFKTREEAERRNESGTYAGCDTGIIRPCHRAENLSNYERIHW